MLLWQTFPILQFAEGDSASLDGLLFLHMSPRPRTNEPIFPANRLVSIGATGGEVGGTALTPNRRSALILGAGTASVKNHYRNVVATIDCSVQFRNLPMNNQVLQLVAHCNQTFNYCGLAFGPFRRQFN